MSDPNLGNPESSDERRQRQMDFILEQQAQFSVDIQLLKESLIEQRKTIEAHTEEINAQAAYSAAEFGRANERITRCEQLLYASLEGQEELRQQVKLTNTAVDRLVETVAFILEERKRNGNGS